MSALGGKFGSVSVGGKYNVTLPTYTDGQVTELQADTRGRMIVSIGADTSGISTKLDTLHTDLVTIEGYVDGIETLIAATNTAIASTNTKLDTLHTDIGTTIHADIGSTNTKLDTLHTDIGTTIHNDLVTIEGYVDGIETLIGSTNTKLDTVHTDLGTINTSVGTVNTSVGTMSAKLPAALGQLAMAASLSVAIASDQTYVAPKGRTIVTKVRNAYGSVNVTTAAYVQLIASTSAEIDEIEIFDSSGQTLVLAIGAAASEVDQLYIVPGGNGRIPFKIAAGTRVSVKAVSATASAGELTANFYGV